MASRVKVYKQGATVYVIGTDDVQEALAAVGISPSTHRWGGTGYGLYVRRQGLWQWRDNYNPPKDAKPGVCFYGGIQEREEKTVDLLAALQESIDTAKKARAEKGADRG